MFWSNTKEFSKIVRQIPISDILHPQLYRDPRENDPAMTALTDSVRQHGVLEPVIVRKRKIENVSCETIAPRFQLIAGERRILAAKLAGLSTVPAISTDADERECAAMAIVENIHREDLTFFEEAAAISSLITMTSMTQEQCAKTLSVSQSYVANKLRLIRLTEEERFIILENHLTERHSRALLRFDSPEERISVLKTVIERAMNVAQTEDYVESMLCAKARREELLSKPEKSEQRQKLMFRDIRQFCHSIDHAVDIIKKSGIPVETNKTETENGTLISIRLPTAG